MTIGKNNGHWEFPTDLTPTEYQGFIYLVINKLTTRSYIGKKKFFSVTTLPPLKGYKRKRKKYTEMKWRTYTGSSVELNEDIEKHGISNFQFIVLDQCKTQAELTYSETNLQHTMDVLTAFLPDGTRKFYNKAIGAIKFLPPTIVSEKTREKLRKAAYNLPRKTCPHCDIECDVGNYAKWHGDNCKDKIADTSKSKGSVTTT
tara:strand:- start:2010 stop:2615 length:606 start_codon:yes stop_codon:yes gene_type:complete